MPKFKSKVVEIEAMQFLTPLSGQEIMHWADQFDVSIIMNHDDQETCLKIPTLEGQMRAGPGDWVIRGTENEFYPCKDSVFQRKYEPA